MSAVNNTGEEFFDLAPKELDKNEEIYTKALDYAFSKDTIKNIAITGIYGSGKTTVWKTYLSNHMTCLNNPITINLGTYEDMEDVKENKENVHSSAQDYINKYEKRHTANRVEKQIINQILSQVKDKDIPLSKYQFKKNKTWGKVLCFIALVLIFICAILLTFVKEDVLQNKLFIGWFKENSLLAFFLIFLFMLFIPLVFFLHSYYKKDSFKLKRLAIKDSETEFFDKEEDESVLDKDIKEIVYILYQSKTDVVVFEDLDRYDDIEIFTKLRELNFLINNYIQVNEEKSSSENRIVRFVYMLRDSMFCTKNRTKFFDFILPIIPILDSTNSENQLIDFFKENNLFSDDDKKENINGKFLSRISNYIDDMRLMKNILNEYKVYFNIISKKSLNQKKLFSLIVYKNIFPKDFDRLQEDGGYLWELLLKIEEKRQEIKKECGKGFVEELLKIEDMSLKELFSFDTKYINDDIFVIDGYEYITGGQYFPLIKFLIKNEYIDETFCDYKSLFYSGYFKDTIGIKDNLFLRNVYNNSEQDVFLSLKNLDGICSRLNMNDFNSVSILNMHLFKKCIDDNKRKEIDIMSSMVVKKAKLNILYLILQSVDDSYIMKYIDFINDSEKSVFIVILEFLLDKEDMVDRFNKCKLCIKNISKLCSNMDVLDKVIQNKFYEINVNNLECIFKNKLNKKDVFNEFLDYCNIYADKLGLNVLPNDFLIQFLKLYINSRTDNNRFENSETILNSIINSDSLDVDSKLKYLEFNDTKLKDFNCINKNIKDYKKIVDCLFVNNTLLFTLDNINCYLEKFKKNYSDSFVEYINMNENSKINLEECRLLKQYLIEDSKISDRIFCRISNEALIEKIDPNLSENKIDCIFKNGNVSKNSNNVLVLLNRKLYQYLINWIKKDSSGIVFNLIVSDEDILNKMNKEIISSFIYADLSEKDMINLISKSNIKLDIGSIPKNKTNIIEFLTNKSPREDKKYNENGENALKF